MGKEKGGNKDKSLNNDKFVLIFDIPEKTCATITIMILFTEPTSDELRQAVAFSAAVLQERDHEED